MRTSPGARGGNRSGDRKRYPTRDGAAARRTQNGKIRAAAERGPAARRGNGRRRRRAARQVSGGAASGRPRFGCGISPATGCRASRASERRMSNARRAPGRALLARPIGAQNGTNGHRSTCSMSPKGRGLTPRGPGRVSREPDVRQRARERNRITSTGAGRYDNARGGHGPLRCARPAPVRPVVPEWAGGRVTEEESGGPLRLAAAPVRLSGVSAGGFARGFAAGSAVGFRPSRNARGSGATASGPCRLGRGRAP